MNLTLLDLVWGTTHDAAGLAGNDRDVMLVLARYANGERQAYPSMLTIADAAGIAERTARSVVYRLQAGGWLSIEVRRGYGHSNLYTISVQKLVENQREARPRRRVAATQEPDNRQPSLPIICPPENRMVAPEEPDKIGNSEAENRMIGATKSAAYVADKGIREGLRESLNPELTSIPSTVTGARAREKPLTLPVPKSLSARGPIRLFRPDASSSSSPPAVQADSSIETLLHDPIVMALAAAVVDLEGRELETLTPSEVRVLAEFALEHRGGLTAELIEQAERQTATYNPAQKLAYLLAVLREWAGQARGRAAPAEAEQGARRERVYVVGTGRLAARGAN